MTWGVLHNIEKMAGFRQRKSKAKALLKFCVSFDLSAVSTSTEAAIAAPQIISSQDLTANGPVYPEL